MKRTNISVFIPHIGCPHRCSFCDQRSISGAAHAPSPEEVAALLEEQAPHLAERGMQAEIAFFGGSFTAVPREYMVSLLECAHAAVQKHPEVYCGIRCSTRPDCVDDEIIAILKKYGMTAVELGAQSMSDEVLTANERGHSAEDVRRASRLIRESGLCDHYLRYMDNVTLFGRNKRKLRRLRELIEKWLAAHGLRLNGKWQLYPTEKRTVAALGYRFGRGYTLLRKRNMVRLKHSLSACRRAMRRHHAIKPALAQGLLSRLGQMKHCNHVHFFQNYVEAGLQRKLKCVVREHARKERARWNTSTEQALSAA